MSEKLPKQLCNLIEAHVSDLDQIALNDQTISQIMIDALDLLLSWNVPTSDDLSDGNAIVAFSFGQGAGNTPGGTNRALAAIIKAITDIHPIPVFAQWEIADALAELGVEVEETAVPQQGYLSTRGVWQQISTKFIHPYPNIQNIILIAHPDHQYRCRHIIKESGFNTKTPTIINYPPNGWAHYGCDPHGYNPSSTQPWTQNRPAFIKYELAIRFKNILQQNRPFG